MYLHPTHSSSSVDGRETVCLGCVGVGPVLYSSLFGLRAQVESIPKTSTLVSGPLYRGVMFRAMFSACVAQ